MSSSSANDFTSCQSCFCSFGSNERCPRILSCNHTFCHSCLEQFISEGRICPTCKVEFNFLSADVIPINTFVKNFSESLTKNKKTSSVPKGTQKTPTGSTDGKKSYGEKKTTKKDELPYEGHCDSHNSPKHFKCLDCNTYTCGIGVALVHKNCPKVFPVLEALKLMKEEKLKKIKKFKKRLEKEAIMLQSKLNHLETGVKETKSMIDKNQKLCKDSKFHEETLQKAICNEDYDKADAKVKFFFEENCVNIPTSYLSKEDTIKLTKEDLEENTFYVMKKDDEEMKYAKLKIKNNQIIFEDWEKKAERGSTCVDFFDFISSRTSIIDTHKFVREHKKELHNPKFPKDRMKFSKIEVKDGRVYLHSFMTLEEIDLAIQFVSLLKALGCSTVVPAEVFLKIQTFSSEVIISTDGKSPRALNFLLLSSGIMNMSYLGTSFKSVGSVIGGGLNEEINYLPGVVEGIQGGGIYYGKETKRGDVGGWGAEDKNILSFFSIWTEDDSDHSTTTFGKVKRGMEVVDKIKRRDSVKECGLIIDTQ